MWKNTTEYMKLHKQLCFQGTVSFPHGNMVTVRVNDEAFYMYQKQNTY